MKINLVYFLLPMAVLASNGPKFDPRIRNLFLNRFDINLLKMLNNETGKPYLDHLEYLAQNHEKLALSDENHIKTLLNILVNLKLNQENVILRKKMNLGLSLLEMQMNEIKSRKYLVASRKKKDLEAIQKQYAEKLKQLEPENMKLAKMQSFIDYCAKEKCYEVIEKDVPMMKPKDFVQEDSENILKGQ